MTNIHWQLSRNQIQIIKKEEYGAIRGDSDRFKREEGSTYQDRSKRPRARANH